MFDLGFAVFNFMPLAIWDTAGALTFVIFRLFVFHFVLLEGEVSNRMSPVNKYRGTRKSKNPTVTPMSW